MPSLSDLFPGVSSGDLLPTESPYTDMVKQYAKKMGKYALDSAIKRTIGWGLGKAGSYAKSKFSSKKRRPTRSTLTTQRDSATKYSAGRQNKSFKRFRSKVRAALQADNPLCIYQAFQKGNMSSAAGFTSRASWYLADLNTTAQADIFNIFKDAYGTATPADAVSNKIYLKSACMDYQLRNTSGTIDLFVDVYELNCRSDLNNQTTVDAQFSQAFTDLSDVGATNVAYPQVTPFQTPTLLRNWKVVRTKTYQIKRSDSVSIQVRRRYNRMINGSDLSEAASKSRITTAILVIVKGTPINSVTDSGLSATNLDWSAQMTYHYQEVTGDQTVDTIGQTK